MRRKLQFDSYLILNLTKQEQKHMFKITKDRTFEREVTVVTPLDTGFTTGVFTAVFRVLPDGQLAESPTDEETARRVTASVSNVGDADGNAMDPDEALEAVLSNPCAITAITVLYFNEIKTKNLRRQN